MDGAVLHDPGGRVSRLLADIRRLVAAGRRVRRSAYGLPYWVEAEVKPAGEKSKEEARVQ